MSSLLKVILFSVLAIVIFGVAIAVVGLYLVNEFKKRRRGNFVRGYEKELVQEDEYSKLLAIFELTDSASEEEIKTAYRKYVKENHPDTTQNDPEKMRRFMEVKRAYDRILDIKNSRFSREL